MKGKKVLMIRWVVYLVISMPLVLLVSQSYAHTLVIGIEDNEDGTVTIEGVYSTQEIAVGAEVRLEDNQGNVLWKGKTDEDGLCTFKKPKVPYTIILDAGPGHKAKRKGP